MIIPLEWDDVLDYCLAQPVYVRLVQAVRSDDVDHVEHVCQMEPRGPLTCTLSIPGAWSFGPVDVCDLDIVEVMWDRPEQVFIQPGVA